MSESVPEARFGWRRFECRLVNATVGLKSSRRGDVVVLMRDWGGGRGGDDAVLVCTDRGEPLGHLPAKCAHVIGEALDSGELYQGKLQNVGEENGRLVAYAGFSRAEDADDVRAITKMLKRSGNAWASFRTRQWKQPEVVESATVTARPARRSKDQSSGCLSTVIWAIVFILLAVFGFVALVVWGASP